MQVAQKVALTPDRYVRVRVTIEDRSGGSLVLTGPAGLETSSQVQPGARTTWIVWSNIALPAGSYVADFRNASCTARDTFEVDD